MNNNYGGSNIGSIIMIFLFIEKLLSNPILVPPIDTLTHWFHSSCHHSSGCCGYCSNLIQQYYVYRNMVCVKNGNSKSIGEDSSAYRAMSKSRST